MAQQENNTNTQGNDVMMSGFSGPEKGFVSNGNQQNQMMTPMSQTDVRLGKLQDKMQSTPSMEMSGPGDDAFPIGRIMKGFGGIPGVTSPSPVEEMQSQVQDTPGMEEGINKEMSMDMPSGQSTPELGEITNKEIEFLKKAKEAGLDQQGALNFIKEQRQLSTAGGRIQQAGSDIQVEGKNPLLRSAGGLVKGVGGAIKGFLQGVGPGAVENFNDAKKIITDEDKSAGEKFNQVLFGELGADYLGGILARTFEGGLEGLYEGFTTETEREKIGEKIKAVVTELAKLQIENPFQEGDYLVDVESTLDNIQRGYEDLSDDEKEEMNDLLGYAMNAAEFIGIGALKRPVQSAGKSSVRALGTATEGVEGIVDAGASRVRSSFDELPSLRDPASLQTESVLPKGVVDIISEPQSTKAMKTAVQYPSAGVIEYSPREGLRGNIFGTPGAKLNPGEKSQIAGEIIRQRIPEPSTNPQQLYQQIQGEVGSVSEALSQRLKEVPLGPFESQLKQVELDMLDDLANMTNLSSRGKRKIKGLMKGVSEVKTANDVRSLAKEWDSVRPSSVKNNPSHASYQQWRDGRESLNELLENIARDTNIESVRKDFADISALKTAQGNIIDNMGEIRKGTSGFISTKNMFRAALAGMGVNRLF